MRGIDHDQVHARVHEMLAAPEAIIADGGCRGHAQPALLVLASERMLLRLLDILDRDEAHAAVFLVDDQKLLDAVFMQKPLRLLAVDILPDRDEVFLGHQLEDWLAGIGCEAHVAVGQDAHELTLSAALCASRPPESRDFVGFHQASARP